MLQREILSKFFFKLVVKHNREFIGFENFTVIIIGLSIVTDRNVMRVK